MDKPLILSLDAHGVPHRWISWQQACFYYAKNLIAWTMGDETFTYYGGISRPIRVWSWPLPDFWRNSGFHLLERDPAGRLRVTDDFLRAYYLRPEVHPLEESGPGEQALHAALMADPRRQVAQSELDAVE